jgi:hypothetical protein
MFFTIDFVIDKVVSRSYDPGNPHFKEYFFTL